MTLDRARLLDLARRLEYPEGGDAALQEAYTAAFDLAPIASPFVGDHLFGATAARHLFLARVKALLREHGVDPGTELPDHLAIVLRLAAAAEPSPEIDDLVADGALPAARKMLALLEEARNPYAGAVAAVVSALEGAVAEAGGTAVEATP